jgi:hypothetical protein
VSSRLVTSDVYLYTFLNSALNAGECSASGFGRFIPLTLGEITVRTLVGCQSRPGRC